MRVREKGVFLPALDHCHIITVADGHISGYDHMATDSDWEAYLSGPAFIETIGIETFCREVNVEPCQTIAVPNARIGY
ncbi:MAG: hypothetical protein VYB59_06500 [Pseudomonadota bacterium]|nr:hypothetical protein [Pseudomonadota bacterium]